MRFDSAQVAGRQVVVRERLTGGEAIGQGGTFAERFNTVRTDTRGDVVVLDLTPTRPDVQALSDLGTGPLLFAWCGPSAG